MTRKKVKLAYITNDTARKATFNKRKKGLMKKVSELSILCGVEACAIVYSPYNSLPEVWPSQMGVQRVVSNFKRMPEMEQSKNMVNQDSFLRQRIVKANEQLRKQRRDNREKEMTQVMFQCLIGSRTIEDLSMMDLNDMAWLIEKHLKDIENKTNQMATAGSSSAVAAALLPTTLPPAPAPALDLSGVRNVGESSQAMDHRQQQWFMELMNLQDQQLQMGFDREDMVLQFGDTNQNPLWSSNFFP